MGDVQAVSLQDLDLMLDVKVRGVFLLPRRIFPKAAASFIPIGSHTAFIR